MNNIVLFEPEIPQNTGNIMRTCVATNTRLHLIKPLGFVLDDAHLKRSGVNYIDKLEYEVYENYEDFKEKNPGIYYYFTRYGKKPHTSFDYNNQNNEKRDPLLCHWTDQMANQIIRKIMKIYTLSLARSQPEYPKKF